MTTVGGEHLQQRCPALGGLDSVQASGQLRQTQLHRIQLERTLQAPVEWAESQLRQTQFNRIQLEQALQAPVD